MVVAGALIAKVQVTEAGAPAAAPAHDRFPRAHAGTYADGSTYAHAGTYSRGGIRARCARCLAQIRLSNCIGYHGCGRLLRGADLVVLGAGVKR